MVHRRFGFLWSLNHVSIWASSWQLAHACVKAHYRTIVRLAKESPFPEMRVAFSHLVPKLQENKVRPIFFFFFVLIFIQTEFSFFFVFSQKLELPNVPVSQSAPSYFFTQTGLEAPDDAEVLRILQDIFVRTGTCFPIILWIYFSSSDPQDLEWLTLTEFLPGILPSTRSGS